MMMTRHFPLLPALVLLCAVGCSGKPKGLSGELFALKEAGHPPAGFAPLDAASFQAKACQAGSIEKVPAVLCEYGSADTVALGQRAAEAWIGKAVTGVVLRRDLYLLTLADRDHVDKNGKAIAAISRAFRRPAAK